MVLELPYATVKTETRHLPTTQWSHLSSRVVEVRASPPKRLRGGWNEPRPTVRSDPTKALRAKRPRIQNCSLPKHLRSALFPFQMEPTRFRRRQTQRRRCGSFLAKVVAIEEPKRRKSEGLVPKAILPKSEERQSQVNLRSPIRRATQKNMGDQRKLLIG